MVSKDDMVIVDGGGIVEVVVNWVKYLCVEIDKSDLDWDWEKFGEWLVKLVGGVVVIKVGVVIEIVFKECKESVEDVVVVVKVVVEEGIVFGGGVLFIY